MRRKNSFGGRRRIIPDIGRCGARGRGSQATHSGGVGERLLPDGVRAWFIELGKAQAEGLTFDEAMESLEATGESDAFEEWSAAVAASLGQPVTAGAESKS